MNHLQGLDIKVIGEWPKLPNNFNRKENTMQYMTDKMLQRFMSHMVELLACAQWDREFSKELAIRQAIERGASTKLTRKIREHARKEYLKLSKLQYNIKYLTLSHSDLQQMEKLTTRWIRYQDMVCFNTYEDYLENRYDPFYRNKSKQAKKKLAKLVELQQAIRKQKSITKY